jgi:integrase
VRARLEWVPSMEEMAEVYRHLPPSLQPLFRLLCETGCRKSEAFKLQWAQVDELRGRISFEDTKTDASVRYVPISEELRAELRALPKNSGYVFAGRKHDKPIDNMRKALASAVRKAGILDNGKPAKLTPQVIRRAVLSWHAEAGTAESIAQALCGHARGSRVTQKAYTHHSVEAVARSIIKLPTEEHSENKLAKNLATNGNKQPKRR